MSSVPTALLGRSTETSTARAGSAGLYRIALWLLLGANLLAAWGVQWDIQWHVQIGRDSFWIPPHVMTYSGVALVVLASFGVLARDTLRHLRTGRAPEGTERLFGLTGTRGFLLAACGIALTVLAAPLDDLWHRLFGIDVTLWSPPHLLGLLGVTINTLACALIAREAYPAKSWPRYVGTVIALTSFYGSLSIGLRPASRLAYLYGGLWFYAFPILGALFLPLALIAAVRLTGRRSTPIVLLIVGLAVGTIGVNIARIGFEIVQPISVIEDEIAKDPTSPIAVSHAIARKNGSTPGGVPGGSFARILSFAPVLLLVGVDPRRRPLPATLVYAMGLFAFWALTIGRTPAFRPMMPALGSTVAALALTVVVALIGAIAARWLADILVRDDRVPAHARS
ncbi:MAG: hypothetical protein DME01_17595 [Candidatus Rokuibacteriota bacterium]|nr:MAG: hypothetical protein DME01_17595 [Candidatus Rokubacteria bacterium]